MTTPDPAQASAPASVRDVLEMLAEWIEQEERLDTVTQEASADAVQPDFDVNEWIVRFKAQCGVVADLRRQVRKLASSAHLRALAAALPAPAPAATYGRLRYLLTCIHEEAQRGLADTTNPHASLRRVKVLSDPDMGDYAPAPAPAGLREGVRGLIEEYQALEDDEDIPMMSRATYGLAAARLTALLAAQPEQGAQEVGS